MSIKLDEKALENIKNYKYKTHGLTAIERWFMDPFWNVTCDLLPRVNHKSLGYAFYRLLHQTS